MPVHWSLSRLPGTGTTPRAIAGRSFFVRVEGTCGDRPAGSPSDDNDYDGDLDGSRNDLATREGGFCVDRLSADGSRSGHVRADLRNNYGSDTCCKIRFQWRAMFVDRHSSGFQLTYRSHYHSPRSHHNRTAQPLHRCQTRTPRSRTQHTLPQPSFSFSLFFLLSRVLETPESDAISA